MSRDQRFGGYGMLRRRCRSVLPPNRFHMCAAPSESLWAFYTQGYVHVSQRRELLGKKQQQQLDHKSPPVRHWAIIEQVPLKTETPLAWDWLSTVGSLVLAKTSARFPSPVFIMWAFYSGHQPVVVVVALGITWLLRCWPVVTCGTRSETRHVTTNCSLFIRARRSEFSFVEKVVASLSLSPRTDRKAFILRAAAAALARFPFFLKCRAADDIPPDIVTYFTA